MLRKLTILSLTLISLNTTAQNVNSGFYRVQNYGSHRYAYVNDNQGSVNYQNTTADMLAIQLHSTADMRFSDPASVIYINNKGGVYDLESQSTGVYQIIGHYVNVVQGVNTANQRPNNCYWVTASLKGVTAYLWDDETTGYYEQSTLSTTGGGGNDFRCWSVFPVSASTDEYLGITPNAEIQLNGKYYKPFTIGFAFDFASAGMKAYYISDIKPDAAIISECVGTIPAGTPVIVECSTAAATTNRINLYKNTPAAISGNKLAGNYFCSKQHGNTTEKTPYDPATMRLLAVKDGKLQYITDTAHQYTTSLTVKKVVGYYLNANESYLPVPAGTAADLPVMTQEEYNELHPVVSIDAATIDATSNTSYDLNGRPANMNAHGVHITAGRKTIR